MDSQMRLSPLLKVAALSLLLSGCVAPLLAMGQGQLMWALLKPMIGLDPNTTNLFEQPLIKTRMTSLLGPNYDTTVKLLRTAGELQQEGPLLYLASRYDPQQGPERASLVWNSQTNQMAALLNNGEQTRIFTESHTGKAAVWPQEMQDWLTQPATPSALTASLAEPAAPSALTSSFAESAPVSTKAGNEQLRSDLQAAQQQLKAAEAKLKALEAGQVPAASSPKPKTRTANSDQGLNREQAEAAMEALLSQ
jgi:hypothetical protein